MKDFTTGSVPKLMLRFLVPLLMSNMLQAAFLIIDAVWAGRLLGPSGVAIVATGMPVYFLSLGPDPQSEHVAHGMKVLGQVRLRAGGQIKLH